jgi:YihY family inner membrane protein
VAGFVLADASPERIAALADDIQAAIPGLSATFGADGAGGVASAIDGVVRNRGSVGVVGLVTLLISGLKVVASAQTATLKIFRVDLTAQSGLRLRLAQLRALVVLGILALAGTTATSAVGAVAAGFGGASRVLAGIGAVAVGFVLDVLLFLLAYRLLATRSGPPWRHLVPGAVFAAIGWGLLKVFGATWVRGQVASASELYGTLGGVVALLLLLYLAGRLYVYGAELSAVRHPPGESEPEPDASDDAEDGDVDDDDGPAAAVEVRPLTPPGPDEPAPSVSDGTRARMAAMPGREHPADVRHAVAFTLAVGAVAGMVGALKPWEHAAAPKRPT